MPKARRIPEPKGIPSLNTFLNSLKSAKHAQYAASATSRVAHEAAFAEMKSHILGLYEGVDARHSFSDETGAVFDCIPIEQQPALRGSKEPVPKAPDLPPPQEAEPSPRAAKAAEQDQRQDSLTSSPLGPSRKDWYGNTMNCPPGHDPNPTGHP
jgi:hypothetical protein